MAEQNPEAAPKPRLLLADDDEHTRGMLQVAFERAGWVVVAASEFEEAGALLDRRRFDAAIVDLSLSSLSRLEGLDLVEQARYRWPELIIVVYSGHDDDQLRSECLRRGAHAYAAKPTPPSALVGLLASLRQPPQKLPDL